MRYTDSRTGWQLTPTQLRRTNLGRTKRVGYIISGHLARFQMKKYGVYMTIIPIYLLQKHSFWQYYYWRKIFLSKYKTQLSVSSQLLIRDLLPFGPSFISNLQMILVLTCTASSYYGHTLESKVKRRVRARTLQEGRRAYWRKTSSLLFLQSGW